MEAAVNVVVFALGVGVVVLTVGSAVRTVVLPRGIPAKLASFVFLGMRRLFQLRLRRASSYEKRDRVMALYASRAGPCAGTCRSTTAPLSETR